MRILVIGATGYIGSRVIPVLLAGGHTIVAGARNPEALDKFWWSDRVERLQLDVLDEASVAAGIDGSFDALLYLVHGMGGDDFRENDKKAARHVQTAIDAHSIPRVVYVSGIIPPVGHDKLSEHLTSRLEVEEILSKSSASVITLRAALVIGASSTSFELMGQLTERLPVTVVPDWMRSKVEPIAIVDLCAAIEAAVTIESKTQHFDIGGGEVLEYPELIERFAKIAGVTRPQLGTTLLPEKFVAKVASMIADVPSSTVQSLVESLQEDMIARDQRWLDVLLGGAHTPVGLDEGLERSLVPTDDTADAEQVDPMRRLPGDPEWAVAAQRIPNPGKHASE
ncbi:NAD(P)H-binding protein [Humidisolicoccus flavus]|uniref:NAD(P)H-binding protein n=1 Tax=Humidisolicoccus flavus TaxID=3111414 RepID=UPI003246EECF